MGKKSEAIKQLMTEARSQRSFTQTSINRVLKSCDALDLSRTETIGVLGHLNACDSEGHPYRSGYTINLPTI